MGVGGLHCKGTATHTMHPNLPFWKNENDGIVFRIKRVIRGRYGLRSGREGPLLPAGL